MALRQSSYDLQFITFHLLAKPLTSYYEPRLSVTCYVIVSYG
ncbi:hypothetical protein PHET_10273 [Paragonimus heterotremus]|uniref:Uncharacterized protein n=1 Tax=Paragonimus heterotremus TaxID=100268 RepID=A0A8J4SLF5_9TREM|nr:hypothetical protein PHET_10273 [Paragonimus heterotremus]